MKEKKDENKEEKFNKPKLNPCLKTFKESILEWWKNINGFINIWAWSILYAGAIIVGFMLIINLINNFANNYYWLLLLIPLSFLVLVFLVYFLTKASISILLYIKNAYKGDTKKLYHSESEKYFWPYLGISLMTFIFVLLWSFLLIIPGIVFSIFYTFALYVFIFEGKRDIEAIRRSKNLVKNYFWPVLLRIALVAIVFIILFSILEIPLSFVSEESVFFSIWNIILQIIALIVSPLSIIYLSKIYKNLVKIKD